MPRNEGRQRVTWTEDMKTKLLECYNRAKETHNSEGAPRKANGRKVGYMELMHGYFLKEFPEMIFLTPQNLRDKIAHVENVNIAKVSLTESYELQVNHNTGDVVTIETESNVNSNHEAKYVPFCGPLIRKECEIFDKAMVLLNEVCENVGEMSERQWTTRIKTVPTAYNIEVVNRVVDRLICILEIDRDIMDEKYFVALWKLDCVLYTAIISWCQVNNIKCQTNKSSAKVDRALPKWLKDLDTRILEKRKLISQCVAESERLKEQGRLTRKTKRNRKKIEGEIGMISVYSLTKYVMKLKAEIHRLAKNRKRKLRNQEAREFNKKFQNSQSRVFDDFKNIIKENESEKLPKFKQIPKNRKFFETKEEVVNFWKSLWEKEDPGNQDAEWLREYEEFFKTIIPVVYEGNLEIDKTMIWKAIRKKRNWSSPGPDGIVNFWLKKITCIHGRVEQIFRGIINKESEMVNWYTEGRTVLLEKQGEWIASNTRPITCTNNIYKWFSSVIQTHFNEHTKKYNLLQVDQRGAKTNCSGTFQNILIDDMVLSDAHDNKKNLSCGWVDVKKAYDSLSHKWIKKMLEIHRFPAKITAVILKIIDSWSVRVIIPLEDENVLSERIKIISGVLQGDTISVDIYILSKNPMSWELNRFEGYMLSKPIVKKITHVLYVDDLKSYNKSREKQREMMSHAQSIMRDAGLEWNVKKSKILTIKRGKLDASDGDLILKDGSKLGCLKSEDLYKFLGIPENELQDVKNIVENVSDIVRKRANVVWTSPLSDHNKVIATNIFVHSCVEYFMWTQSMNITDLRKMDQSIRNVMNENNAKYKLQVNCSLYLPRNKGGRGLRNLEMTYKKTKIKTAMKIVEDTDPKMVLVRKFDLVRKAKKLKSIINDAMRYADEDFDAKLEVNEDNFVFVFKKGDVNETTSKYQVVSNYLKEKQKKKYEEDMIGATWQGILIKERLCDENINVNDCFAWNRFWKTCPVDVMNDIHSIYLQIVPTLAFRKFRGDSSITSVNCRICKQNRTESVKHLLSNCEVFLNTYYKRRHDLALQFILFNFLYKRKVIHECPPWFSKITIKPKYENDVVLVLWDIPEYSGREGEDDRNVLRPDGKIVLKKEKKIYVLEQSVPWTSNREDKFEEKEEKYRNIIRTIKLNNKDHEVEQVTFIIDCLGGYSPSLRENLKKLGFGKSEQYRITLGLQKIILSEARAAVNHFKIMTGA